MINYSITISNLYDERNRMCARKKFNMYISKILFNNHHIYLCYERNDNNNNNFLTVKAYSTWAHCADKTRVLLWRVSTQLTQHSMFTYLLTLFFSSNRRKKGEKEKVCDKHLMIWKLASEVHFLGYMIENDRKMKQFFAACFIVCWRNKFKIVK